MQLIGWSLRCTALAAPVIAALFFAVGSARAAERCCFLIDADVSGHALATAGVDLERPGGYVYQTRWSWSLRQVARYVEHGRIFNALTALRSTPAHSLVFFRVSEERRSIRGPNCRHRLRRRGAVGGYRAYVSLEDASDGRIALVVHGRFSGPRPRCRSPFVIPPAHVTRAPAGVTLRRARVISLGWRERIGVGNAMHGAVTIHVRLRFVPERLARSFARRAPEVQG